jgi:hypothetical protein
MTSAESSRKVKTIRQPSRHRKQNKNGKKSEQENTVETKILLKMDLSHVADSARSSWVAYASAGTKMKDQLNYISLPAGARWRTSSEWEVPFEKKITYTMHTWGA